MEEGEEEGGRDNEGSKIEITDSKERVIERWRVEGEWREEWRRESSMRREKGVRGRGRI